MHFTNLLHGVQRAAVNLTCARTEIKDSLIRHFVLIKELYAKIIEPNGSIQVRAVRQEDLYYIHPSVERASIAQGNDFVKWHLKLGYLNESDLKKPKSEKMVRNLNFNVDESLKDCKICIQGKQTVRPFP